jgi:membrane associated rhomboid family serine protease
MTIVIIAITSIISIVAFTNDELFSRLQFNAYSVYHRKEWYRMITHGFLHANWTHLIVNMLVLFFFGTAAENWLKQMEAQKMISMYRFVYLVFYLLGIFFASTLSLLKHKNDEWYNSVGASGAVSAVLFFNIFFNPWQKVYVYALIPVPGIILGALYLIYSQYMSKRRVDNINHDAHFIGAVFGFVFPLILYPGLFRHFIAELISMGS